MQLINSNKQKFNAVILAGGEGSRLFGNKNKNKLKILTKITNNMTFFDYQYNYLKKNNFNKILILAGFNGKKFEQYLYSKKYKAKISIEKNKKGTGGAILDNLELLEDNFLVILGDIYTEVNLKKFFYLHKKTKKISSTILCHSNDHVLDSNLAIKNSDGLLKKISFKSKNKKKFLENLAFSGIYFFKKKDLKKIKFKKTIIDLEKDIIQYLLKKRKKIIIKKFNDFLLDFGTLERLKNLKKILKEKNKIYKKNYFFLPDRYHLNMKILVKYLKKFKYQINILLINEKNFFSKDIILLEQKLAEYNLYFNNIEKYDIKHLINKYKKKNNVYIL